MKNSDMVLAYYNEIFEFDYIKFPRFLLTDDNLKELSLGAKLLYSALLDRSRMSKRNGWEDKEGRVFVRYTVSEVAGLLHCTQPTAMKVYRELEAIGLVERKKAKHGKSDIVLVKSYIS